MKDDLIFICRKCEHNLYITGGLAKTGKQILRQLKNYNCPNCGEEPDDWTGLWSILEAGSWKEYKNND